MLLRSICKCTSSGRSESPAAEIRAASVYFSRMYGTRGRIFCHSLCSCNALRLLCVPSGAQRQTTKIVEIRASYAQCQKYKLTHSRSKQCHCKFLGSRILGPARPYSSLGPSGPYPLLGGYFTKRVAAASVYASASHLNELSCLTYFRVVIVIAPVTPISRLECVSNCCGVLHHVARYSSLAKSLTNAPSERLFNMMVFW